MAMSKLQLRCPAKLNLALSVGAPLPTGLHPIASWMVALFLADRLTLELSRSAETFDIGFGDQAVVSHEVDWPLEQDLAYRAYELMCRHVSSLLPVKVTLRKSIPAAAGLGGGSSDAAAMLVGLNRLFELKLSNPTLYDLARQLGSDVPFLVHAINGQPSALVCGSGEQVESIPLPATIHLALVFPKIRCSTTLVYRALDQVRHKARVDQMVPDVQAVLALAARTPLPSEGPFNDLAEPAKYVRPELELVWTQLTESLAMPIHLTGSGSTLFAIAPNEKEAQRIARIAKDVSEVESLATRTLAPGGGA